jgi:hypothetical protein
MPTHLGVFVGSVQIELTLMDDPRSTVPPCENIFIFIWQSDIIVLSLHSNQKLNEMELELIINNNGINYLNYWDSVHGNDVCCRVEGNKLTLMSEPEKEITLEEFINLVKNS